MQPNQGVVRQRNILCSLRQIATTSTKLTLSKGKYIQKYNQQQRVLAYPGAASLLAYSKDDENLGRDIMVATIYHLEKNIYSRHKFCCKESKIR